MSSRFAVPLRVDTIRTIQEAIQFFDDLARLPEQFTVFRGQTKSDWPVGPSLLRSNPDISKFEYKLVRELVSRYPNEFSTDGSMFDRLVRMQHFGLPTRLMDVTKNPLVALYFAVEQSDQDHEDGGVILIQGSSEDREKYYDSDAVSCLANLANLTHEERESIETSAATTVKEFNKIKAVDRLYQFIRVEKPYFRPAIRRIDLFRPLYVIPKMNNRRLIAQSGGFIIHGLNRKNGPAYQRSIRNRMLIIPSLSKPAIRRSLEQLGFDNSTLFPEIDRASRQLVKYFSEFT